MKTLRERFESHLHKNKKCWEFVGSHTQSGTGQLRLPYVKGTGSRKTGTGKLKLATHIAWFLKHGVWPTNQLNHTCDNPACVRIKHLYDGTQKQNQEDMISRGRQVWQVPKFFRVNGVDYTMDELAKIAGVTQSCISTRVKRGVSGPDLISPAHKGGRQQFYVFRIDGVDYTLDELAVRAGVHRTCVAARVRKGLTGDELIAPRHGARRRMYGTGRI